MAVSLSFNIKAGNPRADSDVYLGGLAGQSQAQKDVSRAFASIAHLAISKIEGMDSAQLNTQYAVVANNSAGVFTLTLTPSSTTNKAVFNA